MVQLTLPKNSKVTPGKVWPKPEGAKRLREYRVYRFDPDTGANPRMDTYFVDLDDGGRWCSTASSGSRTPSTRRWPFAAPAARVCAARAQ